MRLALFGSLLLLASCLGPPPGKGPRAEAGYRAASPIIAALDRFHEDHGHYPATLGDLVPKYLPDATWFDLRRGRGPHYPAEREEFSYKRDGDAYTILFSYLGPGVNQCSYDSKTKKWESSGYY